MNIQATPIARRPKTEWHLTKAELHRGHWRARRQGGVASRLTADLQIAAYETAIKAYARGRLLDLGCGNAPFTGIYAPLVEEYIWADWGNSPHQLFELDHEIDLNTSPLPFESQAFDTILLTDVLEHIAEPDKLVGELRRILKPGGHLIVGVPFLYPIHEQPHDFHRYTEFKLRHFANKHGFETIELRIVGGALDVWADLSCKIAGAVWKPLARLPYHGWKLLRALPPVRHINDKAAWKMPLAYIVVYLQQV